MKIFIICCLLFIHVNMCICIMHMFIESPCCSYYVVIQSGFRVSIWDSGIRGFSFGDGLSPESVFGAVLGFDFGFRVRVTQRLHPIRIRPVAIPTLDDANGVSCGLLETPLHPECHWFIWQVTALER